MRWLGTRRERRHLPDDGGGGSYWMARAAVAGMSSPATISASTRMAFRGGVYRGISIRAPAAPRARGNSGKAADCSFGLDAASVREIRAGAEGLADSGQTAPAWPRRSLSGPLGGTTSAAASLSAGGQVYLGMVVHLYSSQPCRRSTNSSASEHPVARLLTGTTQLNYGAQA